MHGRSGAVAIQGQPKLFRGSAKIMYRAADHVQGCCCLVASRRIVLGGNSPPHSRERRAAASSSLAMVSRCTTSGPSARRSVRAPAHM